MTPGMTESGPGRRRCGAGGRIAACAAVFVAVAALTAPLSAQQESSTDGTEADEARASADSVAPADSTITYTREVFTYPEQGRRNPFAPVDAGVEEGPRFRDLRLRGVIYSPSTGSVAVLQDETTGERYRVRDGQRIGDAQVLQIQRSQVTFAVSGVGQTRQETLQVEKREREDQG